MFSNCYRYDKSELPINTNDLKSWLNDIWKQKEKRLAEFTVTSSFDPRAEPDSNHHINNALYLALMFWTLIQVHSYCSIKASEVYWRFILLSYSLSLFMLLWHRLSSDIGACYVALYFLDSHSLKMVSRCLKSNYIIVWKVLKTNVNKMCSLVFIT